MAAVQDTDRKEAAARRGMGCLAIFAIPFALVGVGALYLIGDTLWQWSRMRDWSPTPAEILSVRLDESRGKKTSTYRVEATYRYHFNGATYTSNHVAIDGMKDNIGSFHQDLYRALYAARRSHVPFPCFVNPRNPSEAILSRDMRLSLLGFETIFALTFGGVGFGLLIGVRRGRARQRRELDLESQFPGQPWRWKTEWRDGRISSGSKSAMVTSWIFAAFWNLVSAPIPFLIGDEVIKKENYPALIALLFPIAGIGLIVWASRNTIRWKKFGRVILTLDSLPIEIGETFKGRIEMRSRIESKDGFHVRFGCVRRVTTGSGKNQSTRETSLYEERKLVPDSALVPLADGWQLPIFFEVPVNQPQTDGTDPRNETLWFVEATAAVPGVDFLARFTLPVFDRATDDNRKIAAES